MTRDFNVIPICAEILADTETPVSLLKKLYRHRAPAFLFESADGDEQWGRYSFMGGSAACDIRIFQHHVEIEQNNSIQKTGHNGDPMRVLRNFLRRFKAPHVPDLPRFWGGLAGYLTYETASFFEDIPHRMPANVPFAHFIIPETVLIFDNIRHTLMIVVSAMITADDEPDRVYANSLCRLRELAGVIAQPIPASAESASCPDIVLRPVYEPSEFRANVQKVKDHIQAGDIIQAVISQPFISQNVPDLCELYRIQRHINPSPYLFLMHLDDTALVGSSPETMVRLENSIAVLRPIAGTRPRGVDEQTDMDLADELLRDEKERAEHIMLVDLGRNDLGRVAETGTVQVSELMTIERYSHVMHLVSNVTCHLRPENDAFDLIRAVFPAGTLSGAPKIRAMEIIADLENEFRGPYGGAVGYISFDGNMDLAITIRTACIQNGRLTVRSGAGIVADSDPESERLETVNKAMAMEKALKMLNRRGLSK